MKSWKDIADSIAPISYSKGALSDMARAAGVTPADLQIPKPDHAPAFAAARAAIEHVVHLRHVPKATPASEAIAMLEGLLRRPDRSGDAAERLRAVCRILQEVAPLPLPKAEPKPKAAKGEESGK